MNNKKICILNGPNLNMLGQREENQYGNFTLKDLKNYIEEKKQKETTIEFFQSNNEGEIISKIQSLKQEKFHALVINAGAYTHTSIGIRDAILSVQIPFIEVHISNVYAREAFRHHSYLSDISQGVVVGLGMMGYQTAIQFFEEQSL